MSKKRANRIIELAIYTRRIPSPGSLRVFFLPLMGKDENEKAPTTSRDSNKYLVCKEKDQESILQAVRKIYSKIDPKEFQCGDRNPMSDVVGWCVRWNKYYHCYARWSSYTKDYPTQMNACFIKNEGALTVRRYDDKKSDSTFDNGKIVAVGDKIGLSRKQREDRIPVDSEDWVYGGNTYAWMR